MKSHGSSEDVLLCGLAAHKFTADAAMAENDEPGSGATHLRSASHIKSMHKPCEGSKPSQG